MKRIAVTKFKGKYILIDIREMYQQNGIDRPGRKGISLNIEQYMNLKVKLAKDQKRQRKNNRPETLIST